MHASASASLTIPLRLGALAFLVCLTQAAFGVGCKITSASPDSEAQQAYFHGDYDRA